MMAGCALGGVGFVKQGGGEEEPKEVWGAGPAMTVVEVTGACAVGTHSNNILEGGRPVLAQHMSCAGANLVHCPGYADDARPIHALSMDTCADRGFPAL